MNLEKALQHPQTLSLMLIDLQNDFIHSEGAYARAGQKAESIALLPERLVPLANLVRKHGGWIVSTHFTLVPGKEGNPFILEHLKQLRPFLGKGDFAPGSWGQQLVEELQPADLTVEKVAYNAFFMSRLEWVLRRASIENLLFAGIVTNGGVASTVRDAHVRDFNTAVISDGCAAFSEKAHQSALADLATVSTLTNCEEVLKLFETL